MVGNLVTISAQDLSFRQFGGTAECLVCRQYPVISVYNDETFINGFKDFADKGLAVP